MNKKNIIITCVSASLAITLIFLGIIFSFKKPDESNKKDDDQSLKKEVEALKNEFKTLKSNFVTAFHELQSKDFKAYPSEDQKQIDHLKKELQTFQNEINQLSCDQPELTGQKTCLSTINQQINNKKNDFQNIYNLIHLFNNLNNIINQLNSALTSLQNLNQTINDTSFTNQTFNNTFNDINIFYHSFHTSKQNCFNNKKLKDQKDCFDRLSKELNHNLNLITQISNDYSVQKKEIEGNINTLINQINDNFINFDNEFNDLSFISSNLNNDINNLKRLYQGFKNENKTCSNKTKLKDKKVCYTNLTKNLKNNLTFVNNVKNIYDQQKKGITKDIEDLTNKVKNESSYFINLDLSFAGSNLNNSINSIKLYENTCNKPKLKDQKDCFNNFLVKQLNQKEKIINNYKQQKKLFEKKIKKLKDEYDGYQTLNRDSFDFDIKIILISPINNEITEIKKKTNCENEKLLKLKEYCYQKQINKIKNFFSYSYTILLNKYQSYKKIRDNRKLIPDELYKLIFDNEISLSDKTKKIKEKINKKINDNNYYQIFKVLQQKENIFLLNNDYLKLKNEINQLINRKTPDLLDDSLNLITGIVNFDDVQKRLETFVKNNLQNKPLNSYIEGNINNLFNLVSNLLGYLVPFVVNVVALHYGHYTVNIIYFTSSVYMYYLEPNTIKEENNHLVTTTDYYGLKSGLTTITYFVKDSYANAFSGFNNINLAQKLNINITALGSMNNKDLNNIIDQIKQEEENLIFFNKNLKTKKLKQAFGIILHAVISYISPLSILLLVKKIKININVNTNNQMKFKKKKNI